MEWSAVGLGVGRWKCGFVAAQRGVLSGFLETSQIQGAEETSACVIKEATKTSPERSRKGFNGGLAKGAL